MYSRHPVICLADLIEAELHQQFNPYRVLRLGPHIFYHIFHLKLSKVAKNRRQRNKNRIAKGESLTNSTSTSEQLIGVLLATARDLALGASATSAAPAVVQSTVDILKSAESLRAVKSLQERITFPNENNQQPDTTDIPKSFAELASIIFSDRVVRIALKISGAKDCGTIDTYPLCDQAVDCVFKYTSTHRVTSLSSRGVLTEFQDREAVAALLTEFVDSVQRTLRKFSLSLENIEARTNEATGRGSNKPPVVTRPRRSRSEVITETFSRPPLDWNSRPRGQEEVLDKDPFRSRPLLNRDSIASESLIGSVSESVIDALFPRPTVSPITPPFFTTTDIPVGTGRDRISQTAPPETFHLPGAFDTFVARKEEPSASGKGTTVITEETNSSMNDNTQFSDSQMKSIEALINRGVENIFRSNAFKSAALNAAREAIADEGLVPAGGNPQNAVIGRASSTEGVGIFWPDCGGEGLIITKGNETVFKDVILFCERVVSLVPIKGQAVMRSMLEVLLRGEAMAWWTSEVSDIDKLAIRTDASETLIQFTARIKSRFAGNCSMAQQCLVTNQYTVNDIRSGKKIGTWFDTMIRYTEVAGLTQGRPRLVAIWNALSPSLRTLVDYPGEQTTIGQYRAHLEVKYLSWEALELSKGNLKNSVTDKGKGPNRGYYAQKTSSGWSPTYGAGASSGPSKFISAASTARTTGSTSTAVTKTGYKPRFPNTDGRPPPGPCKCGGMHWMKDCPILSVAKGVYHGAVEQHGQEEKPEDISGVASTNEEEDDDLYYPFADDEEMESFHGVAAASLGTVPPEVSRVEAVPIIGTSNDGTASSSMAKFVNMKPRSNVFHVNVEVSAHKCPECQVVAPSRRKLKLHLSTTGHSEPRTAAVKPKLVVSNAEPILGSGYEFRKYNYAELVVRTSETGADATVCADTGCGMSLVDKQWAISQFGNVFASRPTPVSVRGLGNSVHISQLYLIAKLFIPCHDGVIARITRELHVVDSLGCNALLGNDVLIPERVVLDLGKKTATFGACDDAVTDLKIKGCSGRQMDCRAVRCSKTTRISARTEGTIPVKFRGFNDRDVEFIPEYTGYNSYLAVAGCMLRGVCNSKTKGIRFRNCSDDDVIVQDGVKLGLLRDFHESTKTFHVSCEDPSYGAVCDLATEAVWRTRKFKDFPCVPIDSGLHKDSSQAFLGVDQPTDDKEVTKMGTSSIEVDINQSSVTPQQSSRLIAVISEFPTLWDNSNGVIDEPMEEWLRIPLIPGADLKPRLPYRCSRKDEQIINETHDRLHKEGKMSWGMPGSLGWPCFVVWDHKNPMVKWSLKDEKTPAAKPRVVVDIRGLNTAVALDSYPLPRQDDVIHLLKDCQWISTFDLTASFFQRRVMEADRWKLGVISHRGVEILHVAPMGFKNSAQHMQRLMDKVLREFPFARCYVDDIVIFSKTFDEHVKYLGVVLRTLEGLKFSLNARKCHVGYAEAKLLGHLVDRFGLSTLEERNEAMRLLTFPKTLGELETLLGMFGYYRHFVDRYSQLIDPLQKLKTRLLKGSPRAGRERKAFASKMRLGPATDAEVISFQAIKECLSNKQTLKHFDPDRELLIYVDASKDNGYAAALHQVHDEVECPVLYLSKTLNSAEKNYWPTELEIACMVWVVMKTRHLIEDCDSVVVITDHQAALDIFKQISLKTSSPDRANLRLVRASLYLSQFVGKLSMRYKPGREHKNADALSRLNRSYEVPPVEATGKERSGEAAEVFDVFFATSDAFLKISDDLRKKVSNGYQKDVTFSPILKRLLSSKTIAGSVPPKPAVPAIFSLADEDVPPLIVFRDPQSREFRLCLPRTCVQGFLRLCHEGKNHPGVEKMYTFMRSSYYFKGLRTAVVDFVRSCPACQKNKPDRTRPYGELKPIESPPVPFHTICMDFIVKLPVSKGFDTILTVTDKLSKARIFCAGKESFTAEQWAHVWWEKVYACWGLPTVMITDRDKIFTSSFWMELFKLARVESALTTAYNPRSDGQSENTNMMLEIALRHLVNARNDDWVEYLAELQVQFNNTPSQSTGMAPNQVLMGTTVRDCGDIWHDPAKGVVTGDTNRLSTDFAVTMTNIRKEVVDCIRFATYFQKLHFDKKHQKLPNFEVGDYVRLRYSKKGEPGYHSEAPSKLGPLFSSPYKIIRKISPWAYEIDFPEGSRLHPVVSVALLKPITPSSVPGNHPPEVPDAVTVPADTLGNEEALYEVEAIVGKRNAGKGRKSVEYRVKWKGNDKSEWEPVENLRHCPDAITDFEASLKNAMVVYKDKGKK